MKIIEESFIERTDGRKVSINRKPKAIQIIGQRKAFCRQRIPESSCARKETIDIDIYIPSRNSDKKTMQPREQQVELQDK